jgi:hypothetical protein
MQDVHRAVSAEAAEARAQDGAADSRGDAASHVHDARAGVVDGAGAKQQLAVGAAATRRRSGDNLRVHWSSQRQTAGICGQKMYMLLCAAC